MFCVLEENCRKHSSNKLRKIEGVFNDYEFGKHSKKLTTLKLRSFIMSKIILGNVKMSRNNTDVLKVERNAYYER